MSNGSAWRLHQIHCHVEALMALAAQKEPCVIQGLFQTGSMPVMERVVQFTTQRHGLITDAIANLDNPGYRTKELSVGRFQSLLSQAIDERRDQIGAMNRPLSVASDRMFQFNEDGLAVEAEEANENILLHDRTNASLEHRMKALAENTLAHNSALQIMKNQFDMLEVAIRERA